MEIKSSSFSRIALVGAIFIALACEGVASASGPTGEQIYKQMCASCHGANGEGSKKYKHPLAGEKSSGQLAKVIAETMPEDDPGACVGPDAEKVAAYIYDNIYSKNARERKGSVRIELARLTVRQYRNALADLLGEPPFAKKRDEKQGLQGEYFDASGFWGGKRILERIDPEVHFDFRDGSPLEGKIDAHQFAIRWDGSVLAPETGTYDFVVRTDHATRLWVNESVQPLVDAWVKSGTDMEHRSSIFLIGGRAYPLRLEFSKAKQGVDDTKKTKSKPPLPALISLEWKRPNRATEVIAARCLFPSRVPETIVVSTPFPPDDRSLGWERGTTISKAWDQATTDGALETSAHILARLNKLAGTNDGAADRKERLRGFCKRFAERAFRRPLSEEQKKQFVDRAFAATQDLDTAVKRSLLMVLLSPRFLYREVGGGPDGFDAAARLSFSLWDSLPDRELLAAAAAGKLATREQLAKQAERMVDDSRALAKLHDFFLVWLKVDRAVDVAKDPKRFPGFDAAVVSDLRTSLDLTIDEAIGAKGADFRRLLLTDDLYVNGRLAKFYGANLPADAGFQKIKLDADHRAGVLTHPFLMAAFAYTGETSPIHRGVFLARNIFGRTLRPPQEAFTPFPADLHPSLTTRQRVALQTKPAACITCHGMINPLGFTLEHFDAVGRYRELENGKPVDSTGGYQTRSGETATFNGVQDLAKYLACSEEVQAAFAEQLFHYLVQQPAQAYGPGRISELRAAFAAKNFNIRQLAVEIVTIAALKPREAPIATAAPSKNPQPSAKSSPRPTT